jgi:hypothetical protein
VYESDRVKMVQLKLKSNGWKGWSVTAASGFCTMLSYQPSA